MSLIKARALVGLVASLAVGLLVSAPALASLSQGFVTTSPIATGSLVSLDAKKSGSVVVSDTNNAGRLFGVVVPAASASISLSGSSDNQVQVATSGTAGVLVTTAAGDIKVGDSISVSPISGVGQKAVGSAAVRIIGTAQADFNGSGDGVTKRTLDAGGTKKEVSIGQIPVVIAVATYASTEGKQSYVIPNWLQNLSNTLAGKSVSPLRIIIAGLILLAALVSTTVLLYAAVRNSIISIGRNPLSRSSVLKGLMQVTAIALMILAVAAAAMYFVISR